MVRSEIIRLEWKQATADATHRIRDYINILNQDGNLLIQRAGHIWTVISMDKLAYSHSSPNKLFILY